MSELLVLTWRGANILAQSLRERTGVCWEGVQRAGSPTASHSPAEYALECLLHLALLLTSVAVSPGASVSCFYCCEVGIKI